MIWTSAANPKTEVKNSVIILYIVFMIEEYLNLHHLFDLIGWSLRILRYRLTYFKLSYVIYSELAFFMLHIVSGVADSLAS